MTSLAIIEAVKARPELWCSSNPNYKNKLAREKILDGIARKMGMRLDQFKKKWKNLKDHYRKEIRKEMAATSEGGTWECHWPYWDVMDFMREEMFPEGVIPPESLKNEQYNGHNLMTTEYDDSQGDVDHLLVGLDPGNQDVESVTSQKRHGSELQGPDAKHFVRDFGDVRETEWIDEDYHFCMSLLPTMRSLSKIQKLEFRRKVNQWLLESVTNNESTHPTAHQ